MSVVRYLNYLNLAWFLVRNVLLPFPPLFVQGKPYFTSFPEPKDIVCPLHTYCRFPVYATSPHTGYGCLHACLLFFIEFPA